MACANANDTPTQDPVRRVCEAAARESENGQVRLRSNAFTLVLSTWRGQRLPLDFLVNVYAGHLLGRVSVEVLRMGSPRASAHLYMFAYTS